MQNVIIQCDVNQLDYIKEHNLDWEFTPNLGNTEIDVKASVPSHLDGEEVTNHLGIEWTEVYDIKYIN